MFDLENLIANWRKQMLAAGIKFPAPLDELEIHLREEIERQMKSGLNEQEIFNSAVQKIGRGGVLRNEFNKVKPTHGVLRPIALIIGWLVAGCALFYATIGLDFHWNLFNFHEKWDVQTLKAVAEILAVGTGFWFLARASRDTASRVASLLVCLFLAGYAIGFVLPPETLESQVHVTGSGHSTDPVAGALISLVIQNALRRHTPSPLWYRGSLALMFFIPSIFWTWREWRMIQKRNSKQEQYV